MKFLSRIFLLTIMSTGLIMAACMPESGAAEVVSTPAPATATETPTEVPATPTTAPAEPAAMLNNTSWQLTGFGPDGNPLPDELNSNITLQITDGMLNGSGGCNQYFGEATFGADTITVLQVGSTEMACFPETVMTFESMYLQALPAATTWSLEGDSLVLSGVETKMVFVRLEQAAGSALEGTAWLFNGRGMGEGDSAAVTSPLLGTEATLLLQEGAISGSAGCNNYSGTYTLSEEKMTVSPLASTRIACEELVMAQETEILTGLMDATSWEIDGQNLRIHYPGGFLMFRAVQ